MSGLGDALKNQTYTASQAQANQKKRESGLSQKRKGNDNAPSPQIKEIGRQPAKSTERER